LRPYSGSAGRAGHWSLRATHAGGDVAQGAPEQIARNPQSYADQHLKPVQARKGAKAPRGAVAPFGLADPDIQDI
jgi:hypothetical protein